ncbi:MAG: hypothetical protein RQ753_10155 [Desulfurivibrionaceae bacterium]|nr:hypothetical protein [Desulfobulbales bacterium]MDT8336048.1 hypothetical protein [Desulfurivibrionaceae bacterium]
MAIKTAEQKQPPISRPVSDETILKVAKEVVVKFIEVGRLSPANFDETFKDIYRSVRDSVRS